MTKQRNRNITYHLLKQPKKRGKVNHQEAGARLKKLNQKIGGSAATIKSGKKGSAL